MGGGRKYNCFNFELNIFDSKCFELMCRRPPLILRVGYILSAIVLILLVAVPLTMSQATQHNKDAVKLVAEGNSKFSLSLYKLLAKQEGNLFMSPTSIQVVVALANLGARGKTEVEIASGLCLPEDRNVVKDGFSGLLTALKGNDDYILEIANKLFIQKDFPINKEFQAVALKAFQAGGESVDYASNAEAARKVINTWAEEATKKKIKDLLPPGVLDNLTRLVLVNAIYFKGLWNNKFNPNNTSVKPFYLDQDDKVDVQMMNIEEDFGLGEVAELNAKVLEMPYKGNRLSMIIILPNKRTGLAETESKLASIGLEPITKSLIKRKVNVSVPKFKLEETIDVTHYLKELGMGDMFTDKADFSGISDKEGLKVSGVFQKAFIEVNEEGSEAAAATGLVMSFRSMGMTPEQFNADHPFMFLIREKQIGSVVFIGRLIVPTAA